MLTLTSISGTETGMQNKKYLRIQPAVLLKLKLYIFLNCAALYKI